MQTRFNVVPIRPCGASRQVQHVAAGQLFTVPDKPDRVFARLSHAQMDVADSQKVWCVVICAKPSTGELTGALCSFARETVIEYVDQVAPVRLARS